MAGEIWTYIKADEKLLASPNDPNEDMVAALKEYEAAMHGLDAERGWIPWTPVS